MAEELKDLIERIQEEGVKAAEEKAKAIEEDAGKKADFIIENARKEAEGMLADARDKITKMEESAKDLLKQAARDLILSLKKEISNTLDKLAVSHIREALNPDETVKIIAALIKNVKPEERKNIVISLGEDNLKKLAKSLLGELDNKAKEGINLNPSNEIKGGFLISYDKGKSHYDFSDKALAEYLSSYVKPRLAEMLKDISPVEKKKKSE